MDLDAVGLPTGARIGPYIILDRLGRGGMGEVFLGNDTRLQRKVALKCLLTTQFGDDLPSDILREARAAARINHPNIAIVHDVLEHEGRAFLVMEYVEGENLASCLRRERLPLARSLAIGRQLASALAAAHAKGIVHRDLKPANIQLTPDGSVKILDFGVAQAISMLTTASAATTGDAAAASRMTQPGTPAYMSPEQLMGRMVDHRSDIYSLGVVLCEMVTGRRPYSTRDPVDLLLALGKRPSRREAVDPAVPHDVDVVIAKTLELDPEDRFQTASELEAELAALARTYDRAASLPGEGAIGRSTPRRLAQLLAGLLLATLSIGLLGFVTTAAFNVALVRGAPFAAEPPTTWLEMGLRSLVTPALSIAAMVAVIWAARFAMRLLSLSRRIDDLMTTGRTQGRRLGLKLGIDDPIVLAQATAMLGVTALALVVWRFADVLLAFTTVVPLTDTPDRLLPLRPGQMDDAALYRFVLAALSLAFGAATLRIVHLRRRRQAAGRGGALAVTLTLLVVTILMSEVPYRIMWQNGFERIEFGGERCYVIGRDADQSLIYCPDRNPPRNRVIRNNDPSLRRSGIVESIFTAADTAHR